MFKPISSALAIFILLFGAAITPVWAHCNPDGVHSGKHPHCTNTSGPAGGGRYDVRLPAWSDTTFAGHEGGGRTKPVIVGFQYMDTDLTFFFDKFGSDQFGLERGQHCFVTAPVLGNQTSMQIFREKDGKAAVQYFFTGFDDSGTDMVDYLLEMSGTFDGKWRPDDKTTTVNLTSWEMSSNGNDASNCTSDGPAGITLGIEVTRIQ